MHARSADDPRDNLTAEIAALLDWWREAGVDCLIEEVPRQWIVAVQPSAPNPATAASRHAPSPPPASRAMIGGDPAAWPQTLAAFAPWWLQEPSLGLGRSSGRVPPRGPGGAVLMVVVAQPENNDGDILLAGPQGELLGAMVSAMGVAADQLYIASALPRHTPMADWADLAAQGLGKVLRHHIALARPQRVIAFGQPISILLGTDGLTLPPISNGLAQFGTAVAETGHGNPTAPVLIARDLGALLQRPIAKGAFWQQWLKWSASG